MYRFMFENSNGTLFVSREYSDRRVCKAVGATKAVEAMSPEYAVIDQHGATPYTVRIVAGKRIKAISEPSNNPLVAKLSGALKALGFDSATTTPLIKNEIDNGVEFEQQILKNVLAKLAK